MTTSEFTGNIVLIITILSAIGSFVGAIVISVVGNLLTAPIQQWIATTSVRCSRKRIEQLEAELTKVQKYVNAPQDLYLSLFFSLFAVVGLSTAATSTIVILFVSIPLAIGAFGLSQVIASLIFFLVIILVVPLYIVALNYARAP